jgi:hypothetical protein
MCQAYAAEARLVGSSERSERQRKFDAHKSGEAPMTDEQLRRLMIEEMMARDAGY